MESELTRALRAASGIYTDVPPLGEWRQVHQAAPEPTITVSPFDALVTNAELRHTCANLFNDGHHASAVEEAFKLVVNAVKRRSGNPTDAKGMPLDGVNLMHHVFSTDKPILKLNHLKTVSERDEQDGYRFIFAGAAQGVRNPRAHSHSRVDQQSTALELIVFANHLLAVLDKSTRARTKAAKKTAPP